MKLTAWAIICIWLLFLWDGGRIQLQLEFEMRMVKWKTRKIESSCMKRYEHLLIGKIVFESIPTKNSSMNGSQESENTHKLYYSNVFCMKSVILLIIMDYLPHLSTPWNTTHTQKKHNNIESPRRKYDLVDRHCLHRRNTYVHLWILHIAYSYIQRSNTSI